MKIAHLILTHAHPDQLCRLVAKLAHEDADFYIHVDAKSPIEPFLSIGELPRVYFIKNREKVSWGGYSIVQATVNGFEEILGSGIRYDYINLLSAQDYPLKSTGAIHEFFERNPGKIFMHFLSVAHEWQEALPRFTRYHLMNYHFPGKYLAERLVNAIFPPRKLPKDLTLVGRSQWFTATPAGIAYIVKHLRENRQLVKYFKLSWAPDEIIFQTILYNSDFRKIMVNDNLLYLDWSAGGASPKILTMADKDRLMQSGKLFARKFNPQQDAEILDYIDSLTR
jgi:hypothetical protein